LACKVESDADLLMSTAFQLKYSSRRMKKYVTLLPLLLLLLLGMILAFLKIYDLQGIVAMQSRYLVMLL